MKKPGQKYNFAIEQRGPWACVMRVGGPADHLIVFRGKTTAKAKAWLQIYLMLSIPDRRKLRAACG